MEIIQLPDVMNISRFGINKIFAIAKNAIRKMGNKKAGKAVEFKKGR